MRDAKKVNWPFKPYIGQSMGSLVASQQLSLKDLGYAIENAWDPKVKRAAITLSLVRLKQAVSEPESPAGRVKVISGGRSYANKKQSQLTYLEGMVSGAFFTIMLTGSVLLLNASRHQDTTSNTTLKQILSSPEGILALLVILGVSVLYIWLISSFIPSQIEKRFEKQIEAYRLGEEGEQRVVQEIIQALDGNWNVFQNISLPGRNKGDLDIILVGSPGVWVLEVKNYSSGNYRNIGDRWEYRQDKIWKAASSNPILQALKGAVRLANFLKADHLNIFVNPAIVWANEEGNLLIENPSIVIWPYDRLSDELGNIWQGKKLSIEEQEKITRKLSKLCDEKKVQQKT